METTTRPIKTSLKATITLPSVIKKAKNNLHSKQAMDKDKPAKKLTPMVCISKIEMKEVKADLTYNLDDVSAMMVKSDNQQLVGPWYLSTMATRDI